MTALSRWLPSVPLLDWGRQYNRDTFTNDAVAALIVTIMLIPQSLAYALLAGLPPEVGLYASVAPLLLYAVLGSSRVLAVGPVAVVSLMTAAAVAEHAAAGTHAYWQVAITLAFLSGGMLLGELFKPSGDFGFHLGLGFADCFEPTENPHGRESRGS
jgi:sulfate permease, SulP family